jgi:hypothetical protein
LEKPAVSIFRVASRMEVTAGPDWVGGRGGTEQQAWGLHKTEIESTDVTETSAFLKALKISLYF